jgi:hypothetical protein
VGRRSDLVEPILAKYQFGHRRGVTAGTIVTRTAGGSHVSDVKVATRWYIARRVCTALAITVLIVGALVGLALRDDIQRRRADDEAGRRVAADARQFADVVAATAHRGRISDQDLAPISRSPLVTVRNVARDGLNTTIVFQVEERDLTPLVPGPRYGCYRLELTTGTETVGLEQQGDCPSGVWSPNPTTNPR